MTSVCECVWMRGQKLGAQDGDKLPRQQIPVEEVKDLLPAMDQ